MHITAETIPTRMNHRKRPELGDIAPLAANSLLATPEEDRQALALPDELAFFTSAVGGKFVAGGIYLIAGAPGSGKSILTTQIGLALGRAGLRSLFVLTEQKPGAMKERAQRMTADLPAAQTRRAMASISVEHAIYDVATLPTWATHEVLSPSGRYSGVRLP